MIRADPAVAAVQGRLRPLGLTGLPGHGPRTIVVMPSFDLDPDMLRRHALTLPSYEERALYMLFLLRRPHVRMLLVTSTPVPGPILDYALGLTPEVDSADARARLQLISADDDSPRPLAEKLLERPELLEPDRGRNSRPRGRVHQPVQRRRGGARDLAASRRPGLLPRRPLLRLRHEVRQPRDVRARGSRASARG